MRLHGFLLALLPIASPVLGLDLGTLTVGSEIVSVRDVAQLTSAREGLVAAAGISPDGKTVAYTSFKSDSGILNLLSIDDGRTRTLKTGVPEYLEVTDEAVKGSGMVLRLADSRISWSPDGKLLTVSAEKLAWENGKRVEREYILVLDTDGNEKANFAVEDGFSSSMAPVFSPDGSKVAMGEACLVRPGMRVIVGDVAGGTVKYFDAPTYTDLARWTDDSGRVQYWAHAKADAEGGSIVLREIGLADGSDNETGLYVHSKGSLSRDGKRRAVVGQKGLSIESVGAQDSKLVVKAQSIGVSVWSPDNRMVIFTLPYRVSEPDGKRAADVRQLWLAGAEKHKLNCALISLDWEPSIMPTWSADSSRLAFVSRGRLIVASLGRRPASPGEKVEAGLAITADDEKSLVTANGKRIADAFGQYLLSQGKLPDTLEDLFTMSDKTLFTRPNTNQVIFRYEAQPGAPLNKVGNDTILGTLDAGLGWNARIYLDGRVVVEDSPAESR